MSETNYPSPSLAHRNADRVVHWMGFTGALIGGGALTFNAMQWLSTSLIVACIVYMIGAMSSNIASQTYHFSPQHAKRAQFRRIDHAAIYVLITGTFTPFMIVANTTWTLTVLAICWTLTALAVWNKLTNATVKSRWSTASYLALGVIGLTAIPDLITVSTFAAYSILTGSLCYVIGTIIYTRKTFPFRFAIWHFLGLLGGTSMFVGIWVALLRT